jgi:hypothetical protein
MYFNETDIDEAYASGKYLSAKDIKDIEPVRGRITEASMEELQERSGGKKRRVIVVASGIAKPIVLNKTNLTAVIEVLGKNGSAWIGAVIEISTIPTSMGPGLRVRVIKSGDGNVKPPKPDPMGLNDDVSDVA